MEVILRYIRNVSSLKKIELKIIRIGQKIKKLFIFYETFLVLENTAEALCKGYIYRTTFGIETQKFNSYV